ncbi:MAG: STAS domain-containing protein [Cytophagales bacterium]|nr:STAS domain-containing protein [Cytophagales bacterium]
MLINGTKRTKNHFYGIICSYFNNFDLMKYTLDKTERYALLQIHVDKIDAVKTPQLKTELTTLNAEGFANFIIDFTEVKYIDSSGLSSILLANRLCDQSGGIFIMYGLSDQVKKLIHISQLDKVLHILPTKEEAIDAIFLHEIENDLKTGDTKE